MGPDTTGALALKAKALKAFGYVVLLLVLQARLTGPWRARARCHSGWACSYERFPERQS